MPNTYITFGQDHHHDIKGKIFDKDTVACIEHNGDARQGRELAFRIFGAKFCMEYYEDEFNPSTMSFFPKGLVKLEAKDITNGY